MKEIKIEKSVTNRSNDSLERYLRDLHSYPLLNGEEEAILAKKIRSGDVAALHQLVNCNLRFVVSVAKKYEMPGMSLADLISEGNIGLIKAAQRFDETRGFKFISYAVWWIRQAILLSIGLDRRMIRLPMNQLKGVSDLWNAEDILVQRLQRIPSLDELSEYLDVPDERISEYFTYSSYTYSYDTAISDDDSGSKISTMSDPTAQHADAGLESEALRIDIELMMNMLSCREQNVLRLAFGMGRDRALENTDIGHELGLSAETVRRAKLKALIRLREIRRIKMMQKYL